MSDKENNDKYWFSIDRDKIKLQLKDLGNRFIPKKKRLRKRIGLLLTFCLLVGVGIALYMGEGQESTLPQNQSGPGISMVDTLPPESRPEEVKVNQKQAQNLSLGNKELNLPEEETSQESEIESTPAFNTEESEVTAPLRPLAEIRSENDFDLITPVSGKIIQEGGWFYHPVFQDWRYQQGIRLKGDMGDVVLAAQKGRVVSVSDDEYHGITVVLDHGNGWQTVYANLQRASVSRDDSVNQGQEIGRVGLSGFYSEPSLYFELLSGGKTVEATKYLQ